MPVKQNLTSKLHDWSTPRSLYDSLDKEFHFSIDVCASDWNTKHDRFWTIDDDALSKDWSGETCFMNPPYGRAIGRWIQKASKEAAKGATIVALIPSRTDTAYWHDYIEGKHEVRFIRGRLTFERPGNESKHPAPFASCIVIFRPTQ